MKSSTTHKALYIVRSTIAVAMLALAVVLCGVAQQAFADEVPQGNAMTAVGQTGGYYHDCYMFTSNASDPGPSFESISYPNEVPFKSPSKSVPSVTLYYYFDEECFIPVSYLEGFLGTNYEKGASNSTTSNVFDGNLNAPGRHFLWARTTSSTDEKSQYNFETDIQYKYDSNGIFEGIQITGAAHDTAVELTYCFYPATTKTSNISHFPVRITVSFKKHPQVSENGSLFGTNTIPVGAEGQYFYGTQYMGYERVIGSSPLGAIYLPALVKMTDYEQGNWLPRKGEEEPVLHVCDWTADAGYNFEVAYCADQNTRTSSGTANYKVANLKDLTVRFNDSEREKLQAIIEHAYPFISEEQMLDEMKTAGFSFASEESEEYASELMMIATQYSIWNVTNPNSCPDSYLDGLKTKFTGFKTNTTIPITVVNEDHTLSNESKIITRDAFIDNSTHTRWYPNPGKDMVNARNDLQTIVEYLKQCKSSISSSLDVEWINEYDEENNVYTVSVSGTVKGYKTGDTLELSDGTTIEVKDDGSFNYIIENVKPGSKLELLLKGKRSNVVEAMYYESISGPYQNFIGGKFGADDINLVSTHELEGPTTGNLTVSKTVAGNAGDQSRAWNFKVELSDKTISGEYGDMIFANGMAEFTLRHSESKTATGLPANVTYTVTETEANTDGYSTSATGSEGTIVAGETAQVAFTNSKNTSSTTTPRYGSLTVTKEVVGGGEAVEGKTFHFTVTGPNGYSTSFDLEAGGSRTLRNLTPGTYTVTEDETGAAVESFDLSVMYDGLDDDGHVTVAANRTSTVTVTNTYDEGTPEGGKGSLTIRKAIQGGGDEARSKTFTFDVYDNATGELVATVTIDGEGEATTDGLPVGEYRIVEHDAAIDGLTWEASVPDGGRVTIVPDGQASVTVTNIYGPDETPEEPEEPQNPDEPEEPGEDIPDEPTPTAPAPSFPVPTYPTPTTTVPVRTVTTSTPGDTVEITDDAVPLGYLPKTGDSTNLLLIASVAGIAVAAMAIGARLLKGDER